MPTFDPTLSTDANLTACGYQHADAGNYRHDVVDAQGVVVFTGSVYQVNDWLRAGAPVEGQDS